MPDSLTIRRGAVNESLVEQMLDDLDRTRPQSHRFKWRALPAVPSLDEPEMDTRELFARGRVVTSST
jgi:hypothetical protein